MTQRLSHTPIPSAAVGSKELDKSTAIFESERARLEGLAYRLLGSWVEAEDIVQDVYLKWRATDVSTIKTPAAWLTTITTREAIDVLRSARVKRTDYVGPWLPEPILSPLHCDQEEQLELANSLSTAFLHVLETLSPKERAAFLLHEVFDYPHQDVARMIDVTHAASRKMVSRARQKVSVRDISHLPDPQAQHSMLSAFEHAIRTGDTAPLAHKLAEDVQLLADGGGKVAAVPVPVLGDDVLTFIVEGLRRWWSDFTFVAQSINGRLGLILRSGQMTVAIVSFAYNQDGALSQIQIMRNPDKIGLATRSVS